MEERKMTDVMGKVKNAVNFNSLTALIWMAAGLLYVLSDKIILGMLHICIGCLWIPMTREETKEKKSDDQVEETKKEGE
jgi:hypothetical protein